MVFGEESAIDAQKFLAPQKCRILEKKIDAKIFWNKIVNIFLGVETWNVGNRLKRVFPKFHADRSHVPGVNGHSIFFFGIENKKTSQNVNKMKLPPHYFSN